MFGLIYYLKEGRRGVSKQSFSISNFHYQKILNVYDIHNICIFLSDVSIKTQWDGVGLGKNIQKSAKHI